MTPYVDYTVGIIVMPASTLHALKDDPRRFRVGLFGVFALGILYALTAFLLYARGIGPKQPAPVRISPQRHYLYQGFYNLPVAVATWFLLGSVIHVLRPRRDVPYDDLLAMIGLPLGILVLPLMWLLETLIVVARPATWHARWWERLTAVRVVVGTLWTMAGCARAVQELYGLSFGRALVYTLTGMLAASGINFLLIR